MVEAAERDGKLGPGGTIVECTSGNTGLGLAMVAAIKGYRAVFCMPDKVSSEKVNLLKAFGAEVLLSPTAVAPESPESYYSVARRVAAERPGSFFANQYFNPANPEATTRPLAPSCGGRRRAGSRTSWPAWAPAAPSAAPRATSRSRTLE
jgi:cystathionine beta-synthase